MVIHDVAVEEITLEEGIRCDKKQQLCFEKLKAEWRRMSFQRWRRNGQAEGGNVGNVHHGRQGKSASERTLTDKLLPLPSKQGKAGGCNHEEITVIIYIVYIVSK